VSEQLVSKENGSLVVILQGVHASQQGGLSRSTRAHERHDLPWIHVQRYPPEHLQGTKLLVQIRDPQDRSHLTTSTGSVFEKCIPSLKEPADPRDRKVPGEVEERGEPVE